MQHKCPKTLKGPVVILQVVLSVPLWTCRVLGAEFGSCWPALTSCTGQLMALRRAASWATGSTAWCIGGPSMECLLPSSGWIRKQSSWARISSSGHLSWHPCAILTSFHCLESALTTGAWFTSTPQYAPRSELPAYLSMTLGLRHI